MHAAMFVHWGYMYMGHFHHQKEYINFQEVHPRICQTLFKPQNVVIPGSVIDLY